MSEVECPRYPRLLSKRGFVEEALEEVQLVHDEEEVIDSAEPSRVQIWNMERSAARGANPKEARQRLRASPEPGFYLATRTSWNLKILHRLGLLSHPGRRLSTLPVFAFAFIGAAVALFVTPVSGPAAAAVSSEAAAVAAGTLAGRRTTARAGSAFRFVTLGLAAAVAVPLGTLTAAVRANPSR